MTVNFNGVLRIMGYLLLVLGCSMLPALLVAVAYHESDALRSFLYTILPCFILGIILIKIFHPSLMKVKSRDGFLIVSLCWLLFSAAGAIPFVLSGAIDSYVDAFFETCSGFSTTGSSILSEIEALPKSILFWRSFTHWLGGMGIIVLVTALLPSIGMGGQLIASAETPGPVLEKISPRFSDTAKRLYLVYLLFTAVETVMLLCCGMSLYDALLHTFGTVGTGGFSSYNASVGHFSNPCVHWIIILFMVLCGVNFNLYFILIRHGVRRVFCDSELKLYLTIIGGAVALITLNLMLSGTYENLSDGLRDASFQVTSIITTTGYATEDYDIWPTFSKMIILLLMLTGACSSSTGGGVKIIRILISLKLIRRGISLKLHPNQVVSVTLNKRQIPQEVATNIANFVFFYIFVTFAGSLLISFNGFDLMTTISSVLACLGNIGPGFNLVGPTMNFSAFSDFSKLVLSFLMIAGRLELFTFFMLFSPHYWNSNKC
ncbi:TrkH family potassium uptake protein [Ihubacter sp. rT4E-8]|uniref:TrkH family potassium uptake protein n=1 Tax=Ihubacter sp. rT4E-8 TaxID=3242369 RepID=UPI003CE80096